CKNQSSRERAKTNRRDEKMALWATQQPQRGGTTSCASRPSAGIDRAKCLKSFMLTDEQILDSSPVVPRSEVLRREGGEGLAYGTRKARSGPSPRIFFR